MIDKGDAGRRRKRIFPALLVMLTFLSLFLGSLVFAAATEPGGGFADFDEIEREIAAYEPDPRYVDDPFILVTLQEALKGVKERSGGIGACLVREATGEIVERGHNRQNEPYFRSDMHAEMDLLNRYEERMRLQAVPFAQDPALSDPRNKMQGFILYSSSEPCPMCLTRIINAGVKKVYYAAPDDKGGMVHRLEDLPPFWRDMARGAVYEPARCSPKLKALAQKLFRPMHGMGKLLGED